MPATFSLLLLTAPPTPTLDPAGPFLKLDNRESLLRAVELFLNRDNIPQIQLVLPPDRADEAKRKHGPHLSFSGVKVLTAGPTWLDQIAAAANTIADAATHVLLHDAARPLVPYTDIDSLLTSAADMKLPCTALATPISSPLVETDAHGHPHTLHPPDHFHTLLTPQLLTKARFLELAQSKTEILPAEIALLKGSPLNLRLNTPADAPILKALLPLLPKPKKNPLNNPFEEAQW